MKKIGGFFGNMTVASCSASKSTLSCKRAWRSNMAGLYMSSILLSCRVPMNLSCFTNKVYSSDKAVS